MTDSANYYRPVPRWVHVWAIACVAVTAVLLALGGLVTTFRVGMADPIWPTEPWFLLLFDYKEPKPGFLIEHTHRLAGFTVGGMVSLLAFFIWWRLEKPVFRWSMCGLIVALLGAFGAFHGMMMKQAKAEVIEWPMPVITIMGGVAAILFLFALTDWIMRGRGSGIRLLTLFALIGVMIQGLLGGLRVRLNDLFGTDLAAVHGVFGQVVFTMLVGVAVLTARRPSADILEPRRDLVKWAWLLLVAVFAQLVWGAWLRHLPGSLPQRGHLFTAFVVVTAAVLFICLARPQLKLACGLLALFLFLQVGLGVEAWLGKFLGGENPDEKVTAGKAAVRTAHVLVGTGILAIAGSLVFLLGIRKSPATERAGGAA